MRSNDASPWPRNASRWRGRRLMAVGLGLFGIFAMVGILAPWIAPYDPREHPDPINGRNRPPFTSLAAVELDGGRWQLAERVERHGDRLRLTSLGRTWEVPAAEVLNLEAPGGVGGGVKGRRFYLLGSDRFGRDVFSRAVHGARISLLIGFLATVLSLGIGVPVGALAALGPRWIDAIVMRIVDGFLAFPTLVLLIALAAFFPTGAAVLVFYLGGLTWMMVARLVRSEMLSLEERDFVVAARGFGAGPVRIFVRHLLPNAMTPIVVDATQRFGYLILFESALSFLGLGVQAPAPSWGNMISESRNHIAWWEGFFPGLALVVTIVALNLTADGLRDVLDPRFES